MEDALVRLGGLEGFELEPIDRLSIVGAIGRQEFQCNRAGELEVFRLVDHTHPTAAELLNDSIVGNDLAEHGIAFSFQWLAISSLLRAES